VESVRLLVPERVEDPARLAVYRPLPPWEGGRRFGREDLRRRSRQPSVV